MIQLLSLYFPCPKRCPFGMDHFGLWLKNWQKWSKLHPNVNQSEWSEVFKLEVGISTPIGISHLDPFGSSGIPMTWHHEVWFIVLFFQLVAKSVRIGKSLWKHTSNGGAAEGSFEVSQQTRHIHLSIDAFLHSTTLLQQRPPKGWRLMPRSKSLKRVICLVALNSGLTAGVKSETGWNCSGFLSRSASGRWAPMGDRYGQPAADDGCAYQGLSDQAIRDVQHNFDPKNRSKLYLNQCLRVCLLRPGFGMLWLYNNWKQTPIEDNKMLGCLYCSGSTSVLLILELFFRLTDVIPLTSTRTYQRSGLEF